MVKSRKELQKERKEQRDEEEKQAARKQREEIAAARKAAQQLVRDQLKAQRDLVRSEARKAEAQVRGVICCGLYYRGCRVVVAVMVSVRSPGALDAPWGWTWTRGCCFCCARRSNAMLVA